MGYKKAMAATATYVPASVKNEIKLSQYSFIVIALVIPAFESYHKIDKTIR